MAGEFWLSDVQWSRLQPLLPNKPRGVRLVSSSGSGRVKYPPVQASSVPGGAGASTCPMLFAWLRNEARAPRNGFPMKILVKAAAVLALIVNCVPASAATLDTALGQYVDKNGQYSFPKPDSLIIATASDPLVKAAGFAVHINGLEAKSPGDDLILGFNSAADWGTFVRLWRQAMQTKRMPEMAEQAVGDYFDTADQVMLNVSVNEEGIELAIIGKYNGRQAFTLFQLVPAQLERFDRDVASVTSYFKR